jgi:nucleoside 2-deoxyribosyltransferase
MANNNNMFSELLGNQRLRAYLAGPEVFLRNAIEIGECKKALCAKYGFEGVFPIDAELNIKNLSPREAGMRISESNEGLIRGCKLLVANITPFRGPSADVGTSFEMGFAHGIGLKIFAYTNNTTPFTERTMASLNCLVSRDDDGRLRDANDMVVEQFGLVDNLMLEGSIKASDGFLAIENAPKGELFTSLNGFEKCLQYARKVMLLDQIDKGLK